ncbi:P-loop containing nucleoside triphosphate hydrolase protein, partial [Melampsora americana]
ERDPLSKRSKSTSLPADPIPQRRVLKHPQVAQDSDSDLSDDSFTNEMAQHMEEERQYYETNRGKSRIKPFQPPKRCMTDEDEDEKRPELKARKWRPKEGRPPEYMTPAEAAEQRKYNPLIKLLDIKIKIVKPKDETEPQEASDADLRQLSNRRLSRPKMPTHSAPHNLDDQATSLALKGNALASQTDPPSRKRPAAQELYDIRPAKRDRQQAKTPDYPRVEIDTRPNFPIENAEQDSIGSLDLAGGFTLTQNINRFLRSYQRDGVNFLLSHYRVGNGAILADDMGLGKTIQVISFLAVIMSKTGTVRDEGRRRQKVNASKKSYRPSALGPTCLVICPNSVIDNWARELETVGILSSTTDVAHTLRRFKAGAYDILISGFTCATRMIDELFDLDFSVVIVDEAQRLKSPTTATYRACQRFKTNVRFGLTVRSDYLLKVDDYLFYACFRVLLCKIILRTYTTLSSEEFQHAQSKFLFYATFSELHTLFDWARPFALGTYYMWKAFVSDPILHSRKANASRSEIKLGQARAEALVNNCWPDLQLRRTKAEILHELPSKSDHIVLCPMTASQRTAYRNLLASEDVVNMMKHAEPCSCGRKNAKGQPVLRGKCCDQGWSKRIFQNLTVCMKIANHLALLYPNKEDREEKYDQDTEFIKKLFPGDWTHRKHHYSADADTELCGKWLVLKPLLQQWKKEGAKVLIFSQWTKMMDILSYWLEQDFSGYVRLDGKVPTGERMVRVDEFQRDPSKFIFLASTLAGGVGLNLTAANKVVIFDPSWNPSSDAQAMDRVCRIGQKRSVECLRLIALGTAEELIYHRQVYKTHLAEVANTARQPARKFIGVQGDKKDQGDMWGVKNIFRLEPGKIGDQEIDG